MSGNPILLWTVAVLGAYILLVLGLRAGLEGAFLYFPSSHVAMTPRDVGLPFEEVTFTTEDNVDLHGWFVPASSPMTLVWFHGNAGNIGHRVENLKLLHEQLGISIFLFDYRGYGKSQGSPSEEGLYRDADAALRYVMARPDVQLERLVYFGRSLGAAVAVDLATKHAPCGLILEGPFPSVPFMARHAYPFIPVWPFLHSQFNAETKLRNVSSPLLVLYAERDGIVPLEGARRVLEAAAGPKTFHIVPGADHNNTFLVGGKEYYEVLKRFMNGACS